MESIRIALIDMSPLLRDIVRETLVREAGIDVVGYHNANINVRAAVEQDNADFVIVGSSPTGHADVRSLVSTDRGVRALGLHGDGSESVLYELRPCRVLLGEISSYIRLKPLRTHSLEGRIREPASAGSGAARSVMPASPIRASIPLSG